MDLSEFLYRLNFPADFERTIVLVSLRENNSSWPLISSRAGVSDEGAGNFFEPSTIAALENRLGLNFETGAMIDGKVCFANTEEVRPDFRTTFSAKELLDYIFELICASGSESKGGEKIYLPFPEGPDPFWKLVQLGRKRKESH